MAPIKFRKENEGPIVTYDWFDIADGTGMVYFCPSYLNNGTGYLFRESDMYFTTEISHTLHLTSGATESASGKIVDMGDLDLTFNTPKIINGKLFYYCSWSHQVQTGNGGLAALSGSFCIDVEKVSNGVITNLATYVGTLVTESIGANNSQPLRYHQEFFNLNISNQHFKKGDTLRINPFLSGSAVINASNSILDATIYHDCQYKNETFTHLSGSHIIVPFKPDL